ncbi:MAG: NUDIX domain-containing protein [Gammaproteobacteria bacterium]|jgi:predicted NUDIX family NTP pyrophosphohydrolase
MSVHSYGILLFRRAAAGWQVMLVHPGGPFWAGKDTGAWSIPKGLPEGDEPELETARREFREETGFEVDGEFLELGALRQPSGKTIHGWALEGDLDVGRIRSNPFTLEWPRHSGTLREYPEIDAGRWFSLAEAREKINRGQAAFLDRLLEQLGET